MASVNQVLAAAWTIGQPSPAKAVLDGRLLSYLRRHFNCRFIIQNLVAVDDGQGGKTRTWFNKYDVLGAIETLSQAEKLGEGGIGASDTHRLSIAYQTGIDPTMRVLYGTRVFDIHNVSDTAEQHLLLELAVEEQFRK